MDLGLSGKVALVAASSSGLGRACAEALVREGAKVIINGRRPDELARTASEIRATLENAALGADLHTVSADVTVPEDVSRLVKATVARFGQLDILVTNAGGPTPGKFIQQSDVEWDAALDSTLWPVIRLIRSSIPHLRSSRDRGGSGGRIINIVSTSVKQPIPGLMFSNALRPAVVGLAKTLSVELAPDGILVNNVCPGSFDTARIRHVYESRAKASGITVEEAAEEGRKAIPLSRLGAPTELGNVVAFLASDLASYVTGQTISVDGGLTNTLFG